ncbi:glutathione S-transferase [Cadophora sp. MPI-SDFR-AT-0126]|nr:glutathione S-transferase [Leotiomycetes sp. MPI-SDFR-AT-0126]
MSKPITLYSHATGPNPWKVAIVLEELKIPYQTKFLDFSELKKDPYEQICINGRVPAIEDPNTGITLWESGAIIEYLQETYDKNNTIGYSSSPEKYLVRQWVHFQMSGQGPYYGQAVWFEKYQPLGEARDRYREQVKRVLSVLDRHLKRADTGVLVGDKVTIADLSFITWNALMPWFFGDDWKDVEVEKNYPSYHAWNEKLTQRPAVQKVFKDKEAAVAKH